MIGEEAAKRTLLGAQFALWLLHHLHVDVLDPAISVTEVVAVRPARLLVSQIPKDEVVEALMTLLQFVHRSCPSSWLHTPKIDFGTWKLWENFWTHPRLWEDVEQTTLWTLFTTCMQAWLQVIAPDLFQRDFYVPDTVKVWTPARLRIIVSAIRVMLKSATQVCSLVFLDFVGNLLVLGCHVGAEVWNSDQNPADVFTLYEALCSVQCSRDSVGAVAKALAEAVSFLKPFVTMAQHQWSPMRSVWCTAVAYGTARAQAKCLLK